MPLVVLTSQSRWVRSMLTVHQLALETCAGVGAWGQTSLSYPRNRGWWGSSALGSSVLVQASLTLNKEQEEHKPVSHLQTPRLPGTKIVCQLIRNPLHKYQHLFLGISHLWRRYFDFSWSESQPQLELQPARSTSTTGRSLGTGEPPLRGWKGWIPNISYKLKQGLAYCEVQNLHLSPLWGVLLAFTSVSQPQSYGLLVAVPCQEILWLGEESPGLEGRKTDVGFTWLCCFSIG